MESEDIESDLARLRKKIDKLEKERAELLKALQILEDALSRNNSETMAVNTARRTARAAIQNATR